MARMIEAERGSCLSGTLCIPLRIRSQAAELPNAAVPTTCSLQASLCCRTAASTSTSTSMHNSPQCRTHLNAQLTSTHNSPQCTTPLNAQVTSTHKSPQRTTHLNAQLTSMHNSPQYRTRPSPAPSRRWLSARRRCWTCRRCRPRAGGSQPRTCEGGRGEGEGGEEQGKRETEVENS